MSPQDAAAAPIRARKTGRRRVALGAALAENVESVHRIAPLQPSLEPARERTHAFNPEPFERERHPGASSFVWSRTVEDNVAITRNLQMGIGEMRLIVPHRAGKH